MDIYEVLEKYAKEKTDGKRKAGDIKTTYDYGKARQKETYNEYVSLWKAYYQGEVKGINTDTGFNGNKTYEIKRKSMKLPKLIAQKWATMLFTEQFKITLKNDVETDKFKELERLTRFRSKLIEAAVWGYAEGTSALLASADLVKDSEGKAVGGKVKLDILKYDNIYPIIFTKDDVSVMAFVKREVQGEKTVYTISIHSEEDGKYTVENFYATEKKNILGEGVDFTDIDKTITVKLYDNPAYCIIRPNTVNDYTDSLPFGQSIFADSLAACNDADLAAAGLRRDVKDGDQVTFIGEDLLMESIDGGKNKKMFDNSEGRFFSIKQDLSMKGTDTKQLFDKAVPEIRVQEFRQAITDSLNWACMTSGLGKNTLDVMPQQTATGVVHTEAEKMQNKSLHEQYLEGEIIKLVKSMCELSTMAGTDIDASEVTITWEDSVIVDTAEQKKLAMLELDAGIITKEEYRMKFMGETLKDAEAKIKAMGKDDSWRGNDEGRYKDRQATEEDAEGKQ